MARRVRASAGKATRHKPAEVEVRNIAHPKVWKTAMKLAGNRREAITVEAYSKVWVALDET